jgi:GDSL-like Lipase/Acylhydrolase family
MSSRAERGWNVCAGIGPVFLWVAVGCSGGAGGPSGSGGKVGTGGEMAGSASLIGTGGGIPTGGQTGTAGTSATGGAAMASGGIVGSGGQIASGQTGGRPVGGAGGAAGGGVADGGAATGGVGAGRGSGGTSAIDGGIAYAPCPGTGPCSIMPIGDSITFGAHSTDLGGYRSQLFKLTVTNSQSITFVGRAIDGPAMVSGVPFPRRHEGYSGYLIDTGPTRPGLLPIMDAAFAASTPHIVLLQIGTNDIAQMFDLPNQPNRLGILIDKIISLAPRALVVVAQIGPTNMDDRTARVKAFNDAIPAVVQQRVAAGKHVTMVDMFTAFTSNPAYKTALLFDEVHPNDAGYVLMAQTWYDTIKSILPRAP